MPGGGKGGRVKIELPMDLGPGREVGINAGASEEIEGE
jgi:hypothetical protein